MWPLPFFGLEPPPPPPPPKTNIAIVRSMAEIVGADYYAAIQFNECPAPTNFEWWVKVSPTGELTEKVAAQYEVMTEGYWINVTPYLSMIEGKDLYYFPHNTLVYVGESTETLNCFP